MTRPVLALLVFMGAACGAGGDDRPDASPSGRACFIAIDAGAPTLVAGPALDCPGRNCLHIFGTGPDLCTAECAGDSDCVAASVTPCTAGFTCTPVTSTGPFACRSFCVCSTYIPDGGLGVSCP
jgi:hypothetical protein